MARTAKQLRDALFVDFGPNDERHWAAFEEAMGQWLAAELADDRARLAGAVRAMTIDQNGLYLDRDSVLSLFTAHEVRVSDAATLEGL